MENNYSLAGKVIVVTGGTGILGKSFIDGIVAAGGAVGILGRNKEIAEERAAEKQKLDEDEKRLKKAQSKISKLSKAQAAAQLLEGRD